MARPMSAAYDQAEVFLPWVESANDRRFKRILIVFVTVFCLIGALVPFLPVPEIVKKDLNTVAPRISRLIMEQRKQPPPPPPKEVSKKAGQKAVKKKTKVVKKDAARKKAASSGLVAMSSELVDLRESFDFPVLDNKPLKQSKGAEKQTFHNDLITSSAKSASAGIDTSKLTRTTGATDLSKRSTTKVTSAIGERVAVAKKPAASGGVSLRDEREIELVFQKNKGAIYSIYNRALRKDPTLAGKVVIELTIESDGTVSQCHIASSELNAPGLERKIVARVKLFRFKPGKVHKMTIKYPIDFLPS